MNIHRNARTCPRSRELLVQRVVEVGWSMAESAQAAGVSVRTGYKWQARFRAEGPAGLQDRSSRPRRVPHQTDPQRVRLIELLRSSRRTGPWIAGRLFMARSTVAAVLKRLGLSRLPSLQPKVPIVRYERQRPGELLHIDIKKLARIERVGHRITGDRSSKVHGAGWEFVYVCVDDFSRLAYVEMLHNEKTVTARGFLRRALNFYRRYGIEPEQVMTDNGSCFKSRFTQACRLLGLQHIKTRPYTPRTNGKAERFIQTMIRKWAYAIPFRSSWHRASVLRHWLHHYNHHRPHGSLDDKPPISRISTGSGSCC